MARKTLFGNTARSRKRRGAKVTAAVPQFLVQARRLDLEANAELFLGHHAAAERLSRQAAELRGVSA